MAIEFHSEGTEVLLRYLEKAKRGTGLSEDEIGQIKKQPDIRVWLNAYESWIDGVWDTFDKVLRFLHKRKFDGLDQWGKSIAMGLCAALDDRERMMSSLNRLNKMNWSDTEQETLQYLPEDTPLQVDVIITIDGFNGGMYMDDYIFLSLVYLEPFMIRPAFFTHELHHTGFSYWWERHPLVATFGEEKGTWEKWILKIFQYVVSEGLANAFCSPMVLEKVDIERERAEMHNQIVEEYETRYDELMGLLEGIVTRVLDSDLENIEDSFENLTMDYSGKGHPKGHFLSGKMTQAMERSEKVTRDEIIRLVRDPFDFFHLYNRAAGDIGLRLFSEEIIGVLDRKLTMMRTQITTN